MVLGIPSGVCISWLGRTHPLPQVGSWAGRLQAGAGLVC